MILFFLAHVFFSTGRFILNVVLKDSIVQLEPSIDVFNEKTIEVIDKMILTLNSLPLLEDIICYTENVPNISISF